MYKVMGDKCREGGTVLNYLDIKLRNRYFILIDSGVIECFKVGM